MANKRKPVEFNYVLRVKHPEGYFRFVDMKGRTAKQAKQRTEFVYGTTAEICCLGGRDNLLPYYRK